MSRCLDGDWPTPVMTDIHVNLFLVRQELASSFQQILLSDVVLTLNFQRPACRSVSCRYSRVLLKMQQSLVGDSAFSIPLQSKPLPLSVSYLLKRSADRFLTYGTPFHASSSPPVGMSESNT